MKTILCNVVRTSFVFVLFLISGATGVSAQKSSSKGKTPSPQQILQYAQAVNAVLKPVPQPVKGGPRLDRELVTVRLNDGRRIVEDALLAGDQLSESQAGELHRRMEVVANDLISLTTRDKTSARSVSSCYKSYEKKEASRFWNMFSCLALSLGQ
ncbi:MAG: hypothetical protein ACO25B_11145 [Chitinophagaceae bacterium]